MELNQFVTDAIRTESTIDKVEVNIKHFHNLITLLIAAGNLLDQIKKNVYYNKPIDTLQTQRYLNDIGHSHRLMSEVDDPTKDKSPIPVNPRLFHAIVGINTEGTELLEALDLWDGSIDEVNILEEFGDIDWYKAIGVDELGGDWEQILVKIIEKLRARYPEKFTSEDAINRNLDKEREILEEIKDVDNDGC
jgi:hypothetical protein